MYSLPGSLFSEALLDCTDLNIRRSRFFHFRNLKELFDMAEPVKIFSF